MELKDTIVGMESQDYKERFKAEYNQIKIRLEKLRKMCSSYEAGTLEFEPTCPLGLLKEQMNVMDHYKYILEVRAKMEGIDIEVYNLKVLLDTVVKPTNGESKVKALIKMYAYNKQISIDEATREILHALIKHKEIDIFSYL